MKIRSLMFLFALFSFINVNAQPGQKLTPETLWRLGRLGSATVTPDGSRVIYSVSVYNINLNKSEPNLFTVPVAGGAVQQITNEPDSKDILAVDPASGKITYWYD